MLSFFAVFVTLNTDFLFCINCISCVLFDLNGFAFLQSIENSLTQIAVDDFNLFYFSFTHLISIDIFMSCGNFFSLEFSSTKRVVYWSLIGRVRCYHVIIHDKYTVFFMHWNVTGQTSAPKWLTDVRQRPKSSIRVFLFSLKITWIYMCTAVEVRKTKLE